MCNDDILFNYYYCIFDLFAPPLFSIYYRYDQTKNTDKFGFITSINQCNNHTDIVTFYQEPTRQNYNGKKFEASASKEGNYLSLLLKAANEYTKRVRITIVEHQKDFSSICLLKYEITDIEILE